MNDKNFKKEGEYLLCGWMMASRIWGEILSCSLTASGPVLWAIWPIGCTKRNGVTVLSQSLKSLSAFLPVFLCFCHDQESVSSYFSRVYKKQTNKETNQNRLRAKSLQPKSLWSANSSWSLDIQGVQSKAEETNHLSMTGFPLFWYPFPWVWAGPGDVSNEWNIGIWWNVSLKIILKKTDFCPTHSFAFSPVALALGEVNYCVVSGCVEKFAWWGSDVTHKNMKAASPLMRKCGCRLSQRWALKWWPS